MTIQEENQALRDKLEKYEGIIEQMMQGPQTSGTIASKSSKGYYRVTTDEGKDVILAANPAIIDTLHKGTRVMVNQNMISLVLPEELEKAPEEVDFNYIEWSNIAGVKSQLDRIQEAINAPLLYKKFYKSYGLGTCKGLLLYGPPGCGKTLIAKAIASDFLKGKNISKDSFIYMKGGEMLSPYVGMAENNIKAAFTRARNNHKKNGTKSVIFIDEAEALLPARGSRRSSDVETTIVPTFLSEMDGFEDNSTFIILATNYPNQLDPAVIRPGRIDLRIEITRPNESDSVDIFTLYLKKTKCHENMEILAQKAAEYLHNSDKVKAVSGAFIKSIVEKAALLAVKRAIKGFDTGVTIQDIKNIIDE